MDQATAQINQIEIKDTHEQSPISRPAFPRPPCPYLPPELVFDIFSKISHTSYDEEKSTFARLCLVSRSFLPVAREFLYSSLHLYLCTKARVVIAQRPDDADKVEKGLKLFETLVEIKHLALLVKQVYVSFANRPPLSDDSVQIGGLIRLLENIKKIWFKDAGENWWESQKNAKMPDDLMFLRAILSLTKQLETLALPQVRFRPIETCHLLNSLKHLTTFKGELHAPSFGSRPDLRLTHLHITNHARRQDLEFFLLPCKHTLRYLHLNYDGDKLIHLDQITQLEHLVVTVSGRTHSPFVTPILFDNFRSFLHSCKHLPRLFSFTLLLVEFEAMASRIFWQELFAGGMPHNVREFAVGPKLEVLLTWETFLDQLKSSCRQLKRLYLTGFGGLESEKARKEMMFGVADLKASHGIEIEWMEKQHWKGWIEERFCSRRE